MRMSCIWVKGKNSRGGSILNDEMIVRLYWDRDEAAISATSEKYGKYCTSIAQNIIGVREDAEECVNDTYLRGWNSLPPHKPQVLSAFLGKITRNLAFDRYKRSTADKRGGGGMSAVLDELSELISDTEEIEDALYEKELISAINAFLGTLSPEKRCIFVRRYWYADSVSDIAVHFGKKEGAVSMILGRMRRQLRDDLTERGFSV